MNINLVYEGKDYNFDVPNGVTIDYLKELSSKIFNSEKELLDLVYNNEKVDNNDNNILIRDLIPEGETNAILTVQLNKNLKNNKKNDNKKVIELVNLRKRNVDNPINEDDESFLNESNIEENNEKKEKKNIEKNQEKKKIKVFDIQKLDNNDNYIKKNYNTNNANYDINKNINNKIKLLFNDVTGKMVNNNINGNNNYNYNNMKENNLSKKLLFETTYIKKNNELLALIKEFNEKIKKIYLLLFQKYKNSGLISNNISSFSSNNTSRSTINLSINNNYFYELSLYEKKIINFQDKQIQFYKSLLETMRKYDNTINFNKLSEFYNKLIIFNIGDKNNIYQQLKPFKLTKIPKRNFLNNNSSVNLSTLNSMSNNKLPLLYNKNLISPINNERSRNILSNSVNRHNSNNKKIFKQINNIINKDKIKISKSITNKNYKKIKYNQDIEDTNFVYNNINTNNNLNKTIKNDVGKNLNNNNDENISFEQNSDDSNSEKMTKNITNKNSPTPISLYRGDSLKNTKNKKQDKNNNDKDNGSKSGNEEKYIYRRSIYKNMNKSRNSIDRKIIIEEPKRNENYGVNKIKKDIKIKDINVSGMTINDSNFAREKHLSSRKSKKGCLNKYDFFV